MRHRVGHDIDSHWVSLFDGKLFKIPLRFSLTLTSITEVGVVTNEDHDPTIVIGDSAIVGRRGITAVPRSFIGTEFTIRTSVRSTNRWHLGLFLHVVNTVKDLVR